MAYDGNWIQELDPTDPVGAESLAFGDNAIREIKRSLKSSFTNAGSPGDTYTGTFSQLDDLVGGSTLPRGAIIMWTETSAPPGWTICDGGQRDAGQGPNSPDLRSRFILAADPNPVAGVTTGVGTTGGNAEIQAKVISTGQNWKGTTDGTVLTVAQLPDLDTRINIKLSNTPGSSTASVATGTGSGINYTTPMSTAGTLQQSHVHTFKLDTSGTGANNPPWYALIYLIKD
jgi:hypothetical protein